MRKSGTIWNAKNVNLQPIFRHLLYVSNSFIGYSYGQGLVAAGTRLRSGPARACDVTPPKGPLRAAFLAQGNAPVPSEEFSVLLSCEHLLFLLADYVGDELPTQDADLVQEHLETCPACDEMVAAYRRVIHLGRQLPILPIPPQVLDRLRLSTDQSHDKDILFLNPASE